MKIWTSADIEKIITLIKESDAIEKSVALSDLYLDKALAILEDLPANKAQKDPSRHCKIYWKKKILILNRKFPPLDSFHFPCLRNIQKNDNIFVDCCLITIIIHNNGLGVEFMEKTFLMVKPDGVQRNLIGEIVARFERKAFN